MGGATGAVLRHAVGPWVQRGVPAFPWGTLAINVSGSLALSFETMRLLEDGMNARAATYVVASTVLSIAAIFAGALLARSILGTAR